MIWWTATSTPTNPTASGPPTVTEHPTAEGKVYLAVVLDAFSRLVLGWSIADHIRAELVVDALQTAIWRRRPPEGRTVHHAYHGSSTRPGRSAGGCVPPACWAPWEASATPSTTPSPKAPSASCSSSCSTKHAGTAVPNLARRSSSGSRPSTTPTDGAASAGCAAPPTRQPTAGPGARSRGMSQPRSPNRAPNRPQTPSAPTGAMNTSGRNEPLRPARRRHTRPVREAGESSTHSWAHPAQLVVPIRTGCGRAGERVDQGWRGRVGVGCGTRGPRHVRTGRRAHRDLAASAGLAGGQFGQLYFCPGEGGAAPSSGGRRDQQVAIRVSRRSSSASTAWATLGQSARSPSNVCPRDTHEGQLPRG
jgi:hypothetical protein